MFAGSGLPAWPYLGLAASLLRLGKASALRGGSWSAEDQEPTPCQLATFDLGASWLHLTLGYGKQPEPVCSKRKRKKDSLWEEEWEGARRLFLEAFRSLTPTSRPASPACTLVFHVTPPPPPRPRRVCSKFHLVQPKAPRLPQPQAGDTVSTRLSHSADQQ